MEQTESMETTYNDHEQKYLETMERIDSLEELV